MKGKEKDDYELEENKLVEEEGEEDEENSRLNFKSYVKRTVSSFYLTTSSS